jgi:hypothetical protein
VEVAYCITLKSLARRYVELHDEIEDLDAMIAAIVDKLARTSSRGILSAIPAPHSSCSRPATIWRVCGRMPALHPCVTSVVLTLITRRPKEIHATLIEAGLRVSMDGRGRWMDNVFIERVRRSLKHEDVYLRLCQRPRGNAGIGEYFVFYNEPRLHRWAIACRWPCGATARCRQTMDVWTTIGR